LENQVRKIGDGSPPKEATIELEHGNASTKPAEIGISLKTAIF